jgi:hypothetical protein
MQTVWSRSLRPQSTCRCISCINSLPSTLSRRTTTGIARKRLTAGDAFSLLLGPVLGGALIADTKAKDKRRREWDEKIAAAQAEVEQIYRNRVKPHSIGSRNLRRLPALTRCYSSAAAASGVVADDKDSFGAVGSFHTPATSRYDEEEPTNKYGSRSHDASSGHESVETQTESGLKQATFEKCKRLQRLVAIKLAIRMILHIHIGKSPRYVNTSSDYGYDQGGLPQNANELIRHLKQVSNSLKVLNSDDLRSSWRAYQSLTWGETCSLDKDMSDLAKQFRRGKMSVTQFVEKFAVKLLSSSDSPTVRGYVPFLSALSRARFDELGFMVDGTMMEARLPYDQHSVFVLLWQYGKNKEAHYFDRLLKKLTTDSASTQFGEQWLWRNVNSTLVPIPPSRDPQILQILIYTALKCNQPHRAEAWSTILADAQRGDLWISHVIRNFLKYYSAHQNWLKGYTWMRFALNRAEMLAGRSIRHLQRVTFAMLEFSVSYGKRALYQDILRAAGECRLGVYSADPDLTLPQRSTDILKEWEVCHERCHTEEADILSPMEKGRRFTQKLRHIHRFEQEETTAAVPVAHNVVGKEQGQSRSMKSNLGKALQALETNNNMSHANTDEVLDDFHNGATAVQWQMLCHRQQIQLDSLKRQLESLRSVHNSEDVSMEREQESHPSDVVENIWENPKSTFLRAAAPQRIVDQVRESEGRPSAKAHSSIWRPRSATSNSIAIPDQSASSLLSQLAPQIRDDRGPPSSMPQSHKENNSEPTIYPPKKRGPITISEEVSLPAYPHDRSTSNSTPLRRSPTFSEIESALNFCTHIISYLATFIRDCPTTEPLYYLVSSVPYDLLLEITIDGFFAHFLQQMLTPREQEVFFLDKLTLEARRRRRLSSAGLSKAEEKGEEEEDQEEEEDGTERPLSIKREPASPREKGRIVGARVSLRKSERRLSDVKVGYGALRLVLGVTERRRALL